MGEITFESKAVELQLGAFRDFLSEKIKGYDAVVIAEDKNIYLTGIVGIVQEVSLGLLPMYIGRTALELANIKKKLISTNINAFWIFDNKHNCIDDEPRCEQLVFKWQVEEGNLLVSSSHRLVGTIHHRGFQS